MADDGNDGQNNRKSSKELDKHDNGNIQMENPESASPPNSANNNE